MGYTGEYNQAMKPKIEGMDHGKEQAVSSGAFMREFSNEAKCRKYMENLRWTGGFVCPKCSCSHACLLSNGRYQCAECRCQTSATSGAVLHKTHMPLTQ